MQYLNHTYELLTGGYYTGNISWNKIHSEIDNCFKLYLLTDGEVKIYDEAESYTLKKGNMYFINGRKLRKQSCNISFSTHWIHFIPKDLIIYQGLLSLPLVYQFPKDLFDLSFLMKDLDNLLSRNGLSSFQHSLSALRVQTMLQQITLNLFCNCTINEQFLSIDGYRIEPAVQHINKYYKESIHIETLAKLCNMSLNQFYKLFKKTLNTTPGNYQMLLKMNSALQLLDNGNLTIKSIAYELGFTDNAHFCKSFKSYYGITPGEYQKNGRNILF